MPTLQWTLLDAVIRQMPAGVIVAEAPSGKLIAINDSVEKLFRHPPHFSSHIAEYAAWKGFHADGRPYQPREWPLARAIEHGETVEREDIRVLRGDGTSGRLRLSAVPVHDDSGAVIAAVVTIVDITEDYREHEALIRAERSERRIADLQLLTAALATAMSVEDVAREVTTVLERVVSARGIVLTLRDDGQDVLSVVKAVGIAEEAVERFRHMPLDLPLPLPTAVRTRQPVWKRSRQEFAMEAPLLESVPISGKAWAALPLELHGQAIGAIGFSFSVEQEFNPDEQKFLMSIAAQCAIAIERARLFESERHAREEAERASRAKDEFLAVLSHELRTPMTTVIGWADFLQMTHGHDAELARAIDALRSSAKLQAKLVDDLLDVSRIVSGKLLIRSIDTELRSIVAGTVEDVRISAREKGVGLEEQLGLEPLPLRGDPDRLRQIVTNLVVNAIKFTPAGGKVTVEARDAGDAVEVVVTDTGEGISPDFLPHVFDRFRQASVGDSRRHSGLGLGLSIVQHLVERHGGTVAAASDGLGKGARFTVRLPKRG